MAKNYFTLRYRQLTVSELFLTTILGPILIYFLIGAFTQQHDFYTSFKMLLKGLECLLKNKSVIDRNEENQPLNSSRFRLKSFDIFKKPLL